MIHDLDDTIVAIASASGTGLRGILRLSGANSLSVAERVFDRQIIAPGNPSAFRISGNVNAGQLIGQVTADLYVWPNRRSYTRQPSVEIHTIGSDVLLSAIQRELVKGDARLAKPGEFTMRAFLAGRMDLSQAEAVLGVIEADNDSELQYALNQLAGGLATPLQQMREQLIEVLAHLEAGLDFVEEDIEFISAEDLESRIRSVRQNADDLLEQLRSRSTSDAIPKVLLVGRPNVGKSSLFNRLQDDSSAIVSNQSGTTRDFLSARVSDHDQSFEIIDTAGLDQKGKTLSEVDVKAQDKARELIEHASIIIHCFEANSQSLDSESNIDRSADLAPALRGQATVQLDVATKCDLADTLRFKDHVIATSATTGTGIDALKNAIFSELRQMNHEGKQATGLSNRCLESLRRAIDSMDQALASSMNRMGDEIVAIDLREALRHLGEVVGTVYTDDILDKIFGQFCIGK